MTVGTLYVIQVVMVSYSHTVKKNPWFILLWKQTDLTKSLGPLVKALVRQRGVTAMPWASAPKEEEKAAAAAKNGPGRLRHLKEHGAAAFECCVVRGSLEKVSYCLQKGFQAGTDRSDLVFRGSLWPTCPGLMLSKVLLSSAECFTKELSIWGHGSIVSF